MIKNYKIDITGYTTDFVKQLQEREYNVAIKYFTLAFQCSFVGLCKEDCQERLDAWNRTKSLFGNKKIENQKQILETKMGLLPLRNEISEMERVNKFKEIIEINEIFPNKWKLGKTVYYSEITSGFKEKISSIAANSIIELENQNRKKAKITLFWAYFDNQWKVTGLSIWKNLFNKLEFGVNHLDL